MISLNSMIPFQWDAAQRRTPAIVSKVRELHGELLAGLFGDAEAIYLYLTPEGCFPFWDRPVGNPIYFVSAITRTSVLQAR